MKPERERLCFQRVLEEDIQIGEEFSPLTKTRKREGYNKRLVLTEGSEEHGYKAVMRAETFIEKKKKESAWAFTNFFQAPKHYSVIDKVPKKHTKHLLCVNKAPVKDGPALMYSNNGLKYVIRKGKVSNLEDMHATVDVEEVPQKVGLYKNTAFFLGSETVGLLDCTYLKMHTISVTDPIDLAMPEGNMHTFPVLRTIQSTARTLQTENSCFIDVVDMHGSKVSTHMVRSATSTHKYTQIAHTWHPKQYICGSNVGVSLVDTREKKSHLFYKNMDTSAGTRKVTYIKDLQKLQDSKIGIIDRGNFSVLDMRWLTDQYCKKKIPFVNPVLASGKHIALYNRSGEFYFQSIFSQDNYMYRHYQFGSREVLLSFDWSGEVQNTPYNLAAFLFEKRIKIFYPTGESEEHGLPPIPKEAGQLHKNIFYSVRTATKFLRPIFRKAEKLDSLLLGKSLHASLPVQKSTFLQRLIEDGFRDALDPPQKQHTTMPDTMKKLVHLVDFPRVETAEESSQSLSKKTEQSSSQNPHFFES
ncbi:hypothetical protein NECID01_0458 [Nematocida sp. AWRm77]|nr:hypothetical protein NECID01_0458 [Nematocida sp. AWRm77]